MNRLLPAEAGLRRLERLGLRWRALANQGFIESRRGPRPGSSRELLGIRAWEVGDDWRDLDWAVTARFGRPHVRVYERSVEATLVLLIDASASMAFGTPTRFEYAHALAYALAHLTLVHNDRVGAMVFADGPVATLPVGRGRAQWAAVRDFLGVQAPRAGTRLPDLPPSLATSASVRVLISDFCTPEAFATSLPRLARRSASTVALHLLDLDDTGDDTGDAGEREAGEEVELVDAESGEVRAGWIGKAERAAFRDRSRAQVAQVAAMCRTAGVRHVPLSTATPVLTALERSLVGAGVLGRAGSS
jgi:uncharacterized protein (DUF58 family)